MASFNFFCARKQTALARLSRRNSVCMSVRLSVRHTGRSVKNGRGKGVNLCSASPAHASNALFITNQSRRPHGHRVQPANTG